MSQYLNTLSLVRKKLNERSIKKILFISGKNSFNKSGAKKIFQLVSKEKEKFLYLKNSSYPNIKELMKNYEIKM